ncbi:MAG: hypothetical protein AAGA37_19875 [Actinomycetota bacterium]
MSTPESSQVGTVPAICMRVLIPVACRLEEESVTFIREDAADPELWSALINPGPYRKITKESWSEVFEYTKTHVRAEARP